MRLRAQPASRRPSVLAIALATALAAAGCSASADPGVSTPTRTPPKFSAAERAGYNDIDVDFAQMLVVHTRQSVEMVALAADRSDRPEVVALAAEIAASDTAAIAEMTAFLETWDEDVPDEIALTEMDHTQMDHEGIGMGFMAGVMPEEKLTLLAASQGEQFDRLFLNLMRTHHGATIAMAQSERLYGQSGDLTKIAKTVERDQGAQMEAIETLRQAT